MKYLDCLGREFQFNDQVEGTCVFEPCIGRLVQIRKKSGQFGSDVFLIRHKNGKLSTLENAGLKLYDKEELPFFKGDSTEQEYSIFGKSPKKGFIVEVVPES